MSFDLGLGVPHLAMMGEHYAKQKAIFDKFVGALLDAMKDVHGWAPGDMRDNRFGFTYMGVPYTLSRKFDAFDVRGEKQLLTQLSVDAVEGVDQKAKGSGIVVGTRDLLLSSDGKVMKYGSMQDPAGRAKGYEATETGLTLPADAGAVFAYLAIGGWNL